MEKRNISADVFMRPTEPVVEQQVAEQQSQPVIDVESISKPVVEEPVTVDKAKEVAATPKQKDRGDGSVHVVRFKNITQIFNQGTDREYKLFENFNLDIPDIPNNGQLVSIMGASGCGKTRLVRLLCDLDTVQSGTVEVYGKSLKEYGNIPMIFQQYSNFGWFTCLKNVALVYEIRGFKKDEAEHKAMELLKLVGLEDKANNYPDKLSGGQQQRLSIARCIATNSQIMIFDEATAALDLVNKRAVQNTILDIFYESEFDPTILNISHSVDEVAYISNMVIILKPNPCEIHKIINIHYDGEDEKRRGEWVFETPQYGEYVKMLNKTLEEICR